MDLRGRIRKGEKKKKKELPLSVSRRSDRRLRFWEGSHTEDGAIELPLRPRPPEQPPAAAPRGDLPSTEPTALTGRLHRGGSEPDTPRTHLINPLRVALTRQGPARQGTALARPVTEHPARPINTTFLF